MLFIISPFLALPPLAVPQVVAPWSLVPFSKMIKYKQMMVINDDYLCGNK